jgi:hypothetical protein
LLLVFLRVRGGHGLDGPVFAISHTPLASNGFENYDTQPAI